MNMSPTCIIKPKQSIYQSKTKPKLSKTKQKSKTEATMVTPEIKREMDDSIYIELDTKCSCSQSSSSDHHPNIQFSRRYLHCQSSMPIAILRSYIQQILPHSSMTQLSLFDANDRLLNDADRLRSLTNTSSSIHIPVRFTLFNTITSLAHCPCSSSSSSSLASFGGMEEQRSAPSIIRRETIDQTLSTCSFVPPPPPSTLTTTSTSTNFVYSPCLSSSSSSSSSMRMTNGSPPSSITIVNLLTPPPSSSLSSSSSSSSLVENLADPHESIIDQITSQFGEICPPLLPSTKKSRSRVPKKMLMSSNVPLDLSLKKRSSSTYDLYSSQTKWIKT